MKPVSFVLLWLLAACANAKTAFTGSTPPNALVRDFLGISLRDSIDFIRWKITLEEDAYQLTCHYGISKPNTNGFLKGGEQLALTGSLKKEKNCYVLQNGHKRLLLLEVNANLLHLLDGDHNLLVGNDGWSYTLNSENPGDGIFLKAQSAPIGLKDSAVFVGRTPCLPGNRNTSDCYKQKWVIVLFSDKDAKQPTAFRLKGSLSGHQPKTGVVSIVNTEAVQHLYRLQYDDKDFYLQPIDPHVLVFTDSRGALLVGNEDFSFTLNRKQ